MDTREHPSSRISVALADDHPIVLEGLRRLLAADFDIPAAVGDGRRLLEAARAVDPDVIVTDLSMPGLDGIEVARQIREEGMRSRVIILTMHDEPQHALDAFAAGAAGYILKGANREELVKAIEEVAAGRTYLSTSIALAVLSSPMGEKPSAGDARSELTRRQEEVLRLVAEGRSMKAIARILGISRRTVESHKYELMRRLSASSTAELVLIAMRMRLIRSPIADLTDGRARDPRRKFT
jgi:DNA-binding NarL/FixJ family response regulator